MLRQTILLGCLLSSGCSLLPEIAHQPTLHNPFPQLSKVAVAPFFNLTTEPTVDGRRVALAYFDALQSVPGFEVVPVGVVERAMQDHRIELRGPDDARRLAQVLDVDAVVLGAVTDFTPWYPPRCALQVEWYAVNPGFHPIPPGYGLPWGTPEEKDIPAPLVFEAEFALAKAQLATQTPECPTPPVEPPGAEPLPPLPGTGDAGTPLGSVESGVQPLGHDQPAPLTLAADAAPVPGEMPPGWPDPRGLIPPPPSPRPPGCWPSEAPVIRHTRTYNGNDMEFTEALASYHFFRDDARFGGWQSYLQRSEDFIRFCCHMHVAETLGARGGAGETRVVWRWPTIR